MSGYTLDSGIMTATSTAYCPVCRAVRLQYSQVVDAISAAQPTVQWAVQHYGDETVVSGCVISRVLCCSGHCLAAYEGKVMAALWRYGARHERYYGEAYRELGGLSDRVAEAVAEAVGCQW